MTTVSIESKIPTLECGNRNNFVAWREQADIYCCSKFGMIASILVTDREYEVPAVEVETLGEGLSDKTRSLLIADAEKIRYRAMMDLRDNRGKFFATLITMMSYDSLMEVKQHEDYPQANGEKDPTLLVKIIKDTHFTSANLGGKSRMMLKMQKIKEFNSMVQKTGERIANFKQRYDEVKKVLKELGASTPNVEDEGMDFLGKLDPRRYGHMLSSIHNDAGRGKAYPGTLREAYNTASTWLNRDDGGGNGSLQSVLMLADDYGDSEKCKVETPRSDRGGKGGRTRGNDRDRGRGKQTERGQSKSKREGKEWRTCRGCLKPGHIWRNCPDKPKEEGSDVLIASNADALGTVEAEVDDDEFYEAFITTGDADMCLFTRNEVLLDNQAARSVFKNRKLLHSMSDTGAYLIGGVNSNAEPLRVTRMGRFEGLPGEIGHNDGFAANILSKTQLVDLGTRIEYNEDEDRYVVHGSKKKYIFGRRYMEGGKKSPHYSCDVNLVATVKDNAQRYTKRQVGRAKAARELMETLGHATGQATVNLLKGGVINATVTPTDVWNAEAIFGKSAQGLKGKTKKMSSVAAKVVVGKRAEKPSQEMAVDIMFVKGLQFLVGVLVPMNYCMVSHVVDRGSGTLEGVVRRYLAEAKGQGFEVTGFRCDGEKGIRSMEGELLNAGITPDWAGPGQHVAVVERMIQTIKGRVRCFDSSLPYVMPAVFLVMCVKFCASRVNMQVSATSMDNITPWEQYKGRKIDTRLDLRVGFGEYIQATVPNTDNSMKPRTEGCIAMGEVGNNTGTVTCYRLSTKSLVRRDQFTKLPMPDVVIEFISKLAAEDQQVRGSGNLRDASEVIVPKSVRRAKAKEVRVNDTAMDSEKCTEQDGSELPDNGHRLASSIVLPRGIETAELSDTAERDRDPGDLEENEQSGMGNTTEERVKAKQYPDPYREYDYNPSNLPEEEWEQQSIGTVMKERLKLHDRVLTTSVRTAMKERAEEATKVIEAELRQIDGKGVFEPVRTRELSDKERRNIIRSSMFLKDKFSASGRFEKYKARLVAGGNQQDRSIYEDLSSPTASTSSIMVLAAVAAWEGRSVMTMDIGGAFLNASMDPTGVDVYMRLDRTMTRILSGVNAKYKRFVDENGTLVVKLKKALYGCVEAALLWYAHISGTLKEFGLEVNPYDPCVFNKQEEDGSQTSIGLHVDDLLVSGKEENLEKLIKHVNSVYAKTTSHRGKVVDYIGMTFDFRETGRARVTMCNCENDIISGSGVTGRKPTPATATLFDVKDCVPVTDGEAKWFHSHVAKLLYLCKRVRPECLVAVSYLCTRVHCCNRDDLAKLQRVIEYLNGTQGRGIILEIGCKLEVSTQIDAAYGVHSDSGKSHTGCMVTVGAGGPVYVKSSKQKTVAKSSTEAELIGLSDSVSQSMYIRNFLLCQGYKLGPVIVYQDNMSCMALVKRGRPGSDASRHINIRFFWVKERVDQREVSVVHRGTSRMWANILTKPVQGKQFVNEARGLTNWEIPWNTSV